MDLSTVLRLPGGHERVLRVLARQRCAGQEGEVSRRRVRSISVSVAPGRSAVLGYNARFRGDECVLCASFFIFLCGQCCKMVKFCSDV